MPELTFDTQFELTDKGRAALLASPYSPALTVETAAPETCACCKSDLSECYCAYDYSPAMARYGVHSEI